MNEGFSSVREVVCPTGERVIIDNEGNRTIAATRRPDGTFRKEIKIRKGYFREVETDNCVEKKLKNMRYICCYEFGAFAMLCALIVHISDVKLGGKRHFHI